MSYLYFGLIAAIWSLSFLFMKKAALAFGALEIGGWRVLGGAVVLGLVWHLGRREGPALRRYLVPLLVVTLLGDVLPYALQPYLVKHHGSGFIGIMIGFVPLMTILVSIPMLRILPTRQQVWGVLAGLGFMALISYDGLKRAVPPLDLGLALLVPFAYAIANTLVKLRFRELSALAVSYVTLLAAALVLLPLAWGVEGLAPEDWLDSVLVPLGWTVRAKASGPTWWLAAGCLAALGVLGTGLALYLFYELIRKEGPLFAGMVTYLIPLGAILWGWLDGETVTPWQVVGVLGILGSVTIVQRDLASSPPRIEVRPAVLE